jgi:integrase
MLAGRLATATAMPPCCWSPTGLRATEVVTLRWDDIDLAHGRLHVRRLKGGSESLHPLSGRRTTLPETFKSAVFIQKLTYAKGVRQKNLWANDRAI